MKAGIRFVSIMLFLSMLLTSCTILGDNIKPSKKYITRNYKVKEFSKIDAATVADIYFTQSIDSSTSVRIYGPDNIVDLMKVVVRDGVLILTMDKHNKVKNVKKMRISITSPSLVSLYFKGVGDILMKDSLFTSSLRIESKGVGDIKIASLNCGDLSVYSAGVGDVELKGLAQKASFTAKGVGDIEAKGLKALSVEAFSKGIGSISCYAVDSLSASVKGVGSIKYKGEPKEKKFIKGGVGSIESF